jgi:serine/threonine protein kinase
MGQVFLAEDPVLARRVAIKVLSPGFAADPERRSRLMHEARAASALNHPNILTIHEMGDRGAIIGTERTVFRLLHRQRVYFGPAAS